MKLKYILLLIFLLNHLLMSQEFKDTVVTDEVLVTGSRLPMLYSETGRIINTITNKEFVNLPYINVADVLKKSFNIDVRQRGNFGVQSDISIRGGNADQILILINGIPMNDPQTGHHNMDLPIDLSSIDKIEVLEGSSSRIYGLNGFAGAINIITNDKARIGSNFSINYGKDNYLSLLANNSFQYKTFNSYISLSKSKSDGFIENTDFNNFNLFYSGNLKTKIGDFDIQGGFTEKKFGANSFYTPEFPNQYEITKTYFLTGKYDNKKENRTVIEFYAREHQDEFRLFRDSAPDWYTSHNYHLTDVIGYIQKHTWVNLLGITNFGFSFKSEEIMSNVMGKSMKPETVPGEKYKFYTKSDFRLISNIFAEHNIFLGDFTFSGGLSATALKGYDWMFDPGVDLNYKIYENLSIFGNLNFAHRLPTFTDLWYSDPSSKGDTALKPEKAMTYEIGSKYLNSFLKMQLSIFWRNGEDIIDWVKAPGDSLWRSTNLKEVNSSGAEIFINFYPKNIFGENSFIETIDLSYCYNFADNNTGFELSEYVLSYLKNKANLSFTHKLIYDIKISWNFSYNDRYGKYYDFSSKTIKKFEPYLLIDNHIYYNYKETQIYLQFKNLLNADYIDISNVKVPGFWFGFGLKLGFDRI